MTELPELPVLLTHGSIFYWAAFALAALLGPLVAWFGARAGARRRAAAARDELGAPSGRLQPGEDGGVTVISGVLELEGADGPLESRPGVAVADPARAVFLRVGDTRVALQGELELRAGSRERWCVSAPRPAAVSPDAPAASPAAPPVLPAWLPVVSPAAPPSAHHPGGLPLSAQRLRLGSDERVRARGTLQILPAAGEQSYRQAGLRHILVPASEGGRIPLAPERHPAVRVSVGLAACGLLLFAALFTGISYAGARMAGRRAWDAWTPDQRDLSSARAALRWGSLSAAAPFRREWALSAIGSATSLSRVDDPEAQRDLVLLSASYERYRTGGCRDALSWIEGSAAPRLVADVGVACADAASLRVAGWALLQLGEFDGAADLAARVARTDRSRPVEQLKLERSAYLHAGRFEQAAATARELQARVDEFYVPLDPDQDAAKWSDGFRAQIGCAADQLSARTGDAAARSRLEAAAWNRAGATRVRVVCGLLLADLADGAQRLAIIDRLRAEPVPASEWTGLGLLEVEADPARAAADGIWSPLWPGDRLLAGRLMPTHPEALRWSALERLSSVVDPPLPARRWRAILAAVLASEASFLGDDVRALRWTDMLDRDWKVLAGAREEDTIGEYGALWQDQMAIHRAIIQLRAGRGAELPGRPAVMKDASRDSEGEWDEIQGLIDYVVRGEVTGLERFDGSGVFVRGEGDGPFHGLQVAGRGSGAELVGWLDDNTFNAMPVALVGARRIRTGRQDMLRWLRRVPPSHMTTTLAERASEAANRQKVAEALGDRDLAAEYRAVAERLRRGLLRRDTALVRDILLFD